MSVLFPHAGWRRRLGLAIKDRRHLPRIEKTGLGAAGHLFQRGLGAVLCAASLLLFAPPAPAAGRQVLRDHVPAAVAHLQPERHLPGETVLNLAIGLPWRDQEGLNNLLQQISDPASPNYRQYLTPEQFAERFGPSEKDYQAVIAFAKANGLTVTGQHPNRAIVDVKGAVKDIEQALHVTMLEYQHPREPRKFHAPEVEPSVDLAAPLLHISGLDDYSLPHPNLKERPAILAANATPNAGSGPNGSYRGGDFRAAYVPGTSLTGAGQTVGLLQFDGFYASDITTYETQAGLPNVPLQVVAVDGGVSTPGSGNAEVCLDIEMAISMAPGLAKVLIYEAPNPSPWVDLLNRMATDNLAKQLSCSWGGGGPDATAEQIFQQMAAQGQSFYNASGDSDAFTGAIPFPAESPHITQVGGTTLTTTGAGGSYVSETVWNWGGGTGTSGGISPDYTIPTYQVGVSMAANQGSTTRRNIPDVALTADNVYVTYNHGSAGIFGGTSCAAPLWAGYTALINQQATAAGRATVGFINAAVYAIGKGSSYTASFHDTTTGNNFSSASPSKFSAVTSYDLCTGWGTPTGTNLINALAGPSGPAAAPTGLAASPGNASVTLTWNAATGATGYNVKRATTSGGPYTTIASGVTATSYPDTGLVNGTTYYYVVSATNAGGESGNSSQASATPVAPPAAPTGLAASPGNASVTLTWNAATGATGYNVKRATTSGGPYTTIASGVTATSYPNSGLANGTIYFYVVSATNAGGESGNSSQVSATPVGPPAAPTGLAASAGNASVTLTWNAATGATGYNVKRATTSGGPYTTIASGVTATSYPDSGLVNGTTYYYVVSATNTGGESGNSSQASATPAAPPAAPTGLAAGAGNASVSLTWSASAGATGYNVKRATISGGPYATIASGVTATSYPDGGLLNGTTYYYVVSATNAGGESGNSSQASATPIALPATPTGLAASPSNASVTLTWNASTGATGYNVKRSTTSGGPYTTIASGVTATSYPDSGLVNGTTYYYVVSAVNGVGESGNSGQASATPVAPPAAPTGLTAGAGDASVTLTWSAATGATGYNVKRATTSGGPYTTIASGVTATSYPDSGLVNGTTYYYVVSAVNVGGQSANSAPASATPSAGTLPSPWQTQDVGAVGATGNATYTNGTFTVAGSGADIGGTADQFRFVYQLASGDCQIQARVLSQQNINPWSKAGVMIRESLSANATEVLVALTPGNGVVFEQRLSTGGSSSLANRAGVTAPVSIRVVRSGATFTGYGSFNGNHWTALGSVTINMATNVYIGLAVTSDSSNTLSTATFNNVTAVP